MIKKILKILEYFGNASTKKVSKEVEEIKKVSKTEMILKHEQKNVDPKKGKHIDIYV